MSSRDSLLAKPDSGTVGKETGAAIPDSWRYRCRVRTSLPAPLVPRVLRFGPKSKYKLELFCRDLSNEHRHI